VTRKKALINLSHRITFLYFDAFLLFSLDFMKVWVFVVDFNIFYFLLFFQNLVHDTQGFSKDICRSMVAMLDTDHSGKLGMEEFKTLLNDIAKWKVS
jgi:hypothetical protein